jgi:hypothetical protein
LGAIAAILKDSVQRSVVRLDHRTGLRNFKQVIGRPYVFIILSISLHKQSYSILDVRSKTSFIKIWLSKKRMKRAD